MKRIIAVPVVELRRCYVVYLQTCKFAKFSCGEGPQTPLQPLTSHRERSPVKIHAFFLLFYYKMCLPKTRKKPYFYQEKVMNFVPGEV
jgi:hypothetical protein